MDLHDQAKKYNGKVIVIIGNHELLNFKSYFNYANPYTDKEHRIKMFKPGSDFMKKLAKYSYLSVQINNYVFVHGGFCPEAFIDNFYLQSGDVLKKLNTILYKYMIYNDFFFNSDVNKDEKIQMKIIINSLYGINENKSPLNCRSFSRYPEIYNCKDKLNNEVLKYFDRDYKNMKMVVAHTPQFIFGKNINLGCDDRIWRIDVGVSKAFDEHKDYILELFVKYGMGAFNLIKKYIKNDENRYISILKLDTDDDYNVNEKVITQKKYSKTIFTKDSALVKDNLLDIIKELKNRKVNDFEKIINKIKLELLPIL